MQELQSNNNLFFFNQVLKGKMVEISSSLITFITALITLLEKIYKVAKFFAIVFKKIFSWIKKAFTKLANFFKSLFKKPPKPEEKINPIEKYISDIDKIIEHITHIPGPSPYIGLIYDNLLRVKSHLSKSLSEYDPFLEEHFRRYMDKAIYFSERADLRYANKNMKEISEKIRKYLKKK
jgi:hypothetical protein